MSARSEKPKNRRVKLVGGGSRMTRGGVKSGGSLKSARRALRHAIKDKKLKLDDRRYLKAKLAEMLARKDGR